MLIQVRKGFKNTLLRLVVQGDLPERSFGWAKTEAPCAPSMCDTILNPPCSETSKSRVKVLYLESWFLHRKETFSIGTLNNMQSINRSKIEPLHIVFRIQVLRKHMHVISSKSYQEILFTYIKGSIGARQEKYLRKHMWFRRRFLVNFQDICAIYNRWMISWLLPKVCTYIQ